MNKPHIRDGLLFLAAVISFLAVFFTTAAWALADENAQEAALQKALMDGELIRLHIIANSDSAQDQAIKLAVRDAIVEAFGGMLSQAAFNSSDEAFEWLCNHEQDFLLIAQKRAKELGFDGKLTCDTGVLHLPAKTYGSVTLPEGDYRALRITLGEGDGQNWWCILYPQLCLAFAQDEDSSPDVRWNCVQIWEHWLILPQ